METTSASACSRALCMRLRWPAWSAPIVGTRATTLPRLRRLRAEACISTDEVTRSIWLGAHAVELGPDGRRPVIALAVIGVVARKHVLTIACKCLPQSVGQVRVRAHKLRRVLEAQACEIVKHQHLTVTVRSGANADGGNAQQPRDECRKLARQSLEYNGECPCIFHGLGIGQNFRGGFHRLALNPIATL